MVSTESAEVELLPMVAALVLLTMPTRDWLKPPRSRKAAAEAPRLKVAVVARPLFAPI